MNRRIKRGERRRKQKIFIRRKIASQFYWMKRWTNEEIAQFFGVNYVKKNVMSNSSVPRLEKTYWGTNKKEEIEKLYKKEITKVLKGDITDEILGDSVHVEKEFNMDKQTIYKMLN